jgi:hypothetical protein
MTAASKKTLDQAIDEVVAALEGLDETARTTAMRAACEHLGIDIALTAPNVGVPPPLEGVAAAIQPDAVKSSAIATTSSFSSKRDAVVP